mmetsp:Transcript_6001/g.8325  ORF Transcript_6001/g.8325 Transcript_6001/m.8325 type:complete len:435 (-) Transcript_6001:48-1352(-)|eukprot:CAMPEP_0184488042 /NCGR_PEP_ID=MMETSP0113_2-20130426/10491_1 /TAXON_ID=91329 /ORGANISM="Norrisiella sphaerica, Strain BC52" /LENGTH=434 /DNA_ID=CAMNT_0026870507 /DNA_START=46 /DNA_END=1350 /DNA_ORIENTATION=+
MTSPEVLIGQLHDECKHLAAIHQQTYETSLKVVNSMIQKLERAKRKLVKADTFNVSRKLCDALLSEKPHTTLSREFKKLHGNVLQLGKSINKNLKRSSDAYLDESTHGLEYPESKFEIARVIVQSLLREGRFDVADSILQEMKISGCIPDSTRKAFEELQHLCNALRKRDVLPAIKWIRSFSSKSSNSKREGRSSKKGNDESAHGAWQMQLTVSLRKLEFQLLKLRYLQLVQEDSHTSNGHNHDGEHNECRHSRSIKFARENFAEFAHERQREIENLAGALLFGEGLVDSPYRDLYSDQAWEDAALQFESVFCKAHNLAGRDPVMVATIASDMALPKRVKYSSLIRSGKTLLEQNGSTHPEINVGKRMRFHSTFVCPVSKEVSSKSNPPVLLSCGHVISRDAMLRINSARHNNNVKCPTCPVESDVTTVIHMNF